MTAAVPEKPSLDGLEAKWSARWEAEGTYRFDRSRPRAEVYAIDTPPPTVSGSLHIGHVYSYTHTDAVARYRRMRGAEVFYPMGWDDNGLPTERRVQHYFGVRCDPSLAYDPGFTPPERPGNEPIAVSRPNFIELCLRLTAQDEQVFESIWRRLGLSVDWTMTYTTIGEVARRAAQQGFLRLLASGDAYQAEAPTLWDVDFGTAVAQAELEDREVPGAYHRLRFPLEAGGAGAAGAGAAGAAIEIETTRPELLAACVALVAHPDDPRYRPLLGAEVRTPLFGVRVPVVAHELADPEKGTGVAMVCTFGDTTDVVWWRELGLASRVIMGRDGRLLPLSWGSSGWESADPKAAGTAYDELVGQSVRQARRRVVELLAEGGHLVGEPRPISHAVKFYEKGDRPLEIVTSRQWFVRTLAHRQELLARGKELRWHPPFMQARYQSWVEGLTGDWNISRQRWFGVPFPVWYPVGPDGAVDHAHPLVAPQDRLPVDPSTDSPHGYDPSQRGQPGGFVGDPDVMDTWATSSLTPQIAGGWVDDPDLFERVFPMDLRPQAHDIVRTWLFTTVVRSHLEHGCLPWSDAAISGFIVDPDRKKMSKSKGNVVTPLALLERHGTDAVRYWAAGGRPGMDAVFDEAQMKVGRRLAIKVLNASRFVLSLSFEVETAPFGPGAAAHSRPTPAVTAPLDRAMLARLAQVVDEATAAFEGYDYARALEHTEAFFWSFCDDYLELVKSRAYGGRGSEGSMGSGPPAGSGGQQPSPAGSGGQHSALAALRAALGTLLRLFAPFLPFVTEEVWSWWQEGSIHRSSWPEAAELAALAGDDADRGVLDVAAEVLGQVRRAKSDAHRSPRTPVSRLAVSDTAERLAALAPALDDLLAASSVCADGSLEQSQGPALSVQVVLAEAG